LALVTTELRPGGAERCLTNIALGLDHEQFLPQVYALAPEPRSAESQLVDALRAAHIPVHILGARSKLRIFSAVRKLRALLEQQRPHVLQSFLFHANVVCAMATKHLDVPLFGGLRVAQPQTLRQFVDRRYARRFTKFVCVSQSVADHAANVGKLPREKLVVIPNGIDLAEFDQAALASSSAPDCAPQQRALMFVGRLDHQKGADLLVDAMSQILPVWPQHDLVIVGDGTERAKLEIEAARRGLASRIHFTGWRADASKCLAAAEIVVLPSRYEGMSNVLLEAMAAGKPIVATSVEGVREVLGPLADQQTCAANNVQALAGAVLKMLALDPTALQELGEANRRRVAENFSLARMLDAYAALYRCAAAQR
jgi:glycosyltransferase involved in cell wall biosynthesis